MLHRNLTLIEKDYCTKINVKVGNLAVGSTVHQCEKGGGTGWVMCAVNGHVNVNKSVCQVFP